jgi:YjbE family integral membrane protein
MGLLSTVGGIVLIDLVLSGDNALVIGVAAHRLPPRQRRAAVALGGALAILLRVLFTALAALLLRVPFLRLLGGVALLGVAAKVVQQEEAGGGRDLGTAAGPWPAVATIVTADAAMSLDNVLGVAAAAGDDLRLLAFGLVLSMVLMVAAGSAIAGLLNRYRWLVALGAAVIAWVGAAMALREPALAPLLAGPGQPAGSAALRPVLSLAIPALAAGAALLAGRVRTRRENKEPAR